MVGEAKGELFHLLVHFANGYKGQDWCSQSQGPEIPSRSSTRVTAAQTLGPSYVIFAGRVTGSWTKSKVARTQICTLIQLASITGGGLPHYAIMLAPKEDSKVGFFCLVILWAYWLGFEAVE